MPRRLPYFLCMKHGTTPCGGALHHGAKIANTDYRICDHHLGLPETFAPEPLSESQIESGIYSDRSYEDRVPWICGCTFGDTVCKRKR